MKFCRDTSLGARSKSQKDAAQIWRSELSLETGKRDRVCKNLSSKESEAPALSVWLLCQCFCECLGQQLTCVRYHAELVEDAVQDQRQLVTSYIERDRKEPELSDIFPAVSQEGKLPKEA